MATRLYCRYFIISFLLLWMSSPVWAHSVTYLSYTNRTDISIGSELSIEDPRRNDPVMSGSDLLYVATRTVKPRLIYGREERSDVAGQYWSYRVIYNLYESGSPSVVLSDTLLLEHLAGGGIYEELDRYISSSGSVRLEIIGIEASADGFTTIVTDATAVDALVPEDIRLELSMEVERYDYLSPTAQPTIVSSTYNSSTHRATLYWPYVAGAEYYELEWAYRDPKGGLSPPKLYERATRIETNNNHYEVSIIYPQGTVFFRVRAVGRFIRNVNGDYSHLKYSVWAADEVDIINVGFEDTLNWQVTTVFAEEGKYKQVISYFDEGLRNRQSQTNLSSDSLTLVSTTHYDVEGRPALNILPVPARANNDLFYKPQFNRNTSNATYNRNNFDRDLGNSCQYNLPDPLSTDTTGATGSLGGAGYYFSPLHAADGAMRDLYKDYLPDAAGYPMTQVRLMNDGTGRVMAQSGVGEFYQLGSERETKYFYDDASNSQLQRIFGSQVGSAKYYKRNLVMDANGQLSVSYIDAAGRVVATALTGVAPTNVDALPSYADAETITEDLLQNNVIDTVGGKSITIAKVMNEFAGNVADFQYSLAGKKEWIELLNGTVDTCLNCRYQVLFRAVDPCGQVQQLDSVGVLKDEIRREFSNESDCNATGTYPAELIKFSIQMNQVGIYKIYKELCVLSPDAEEYRTILSDFFPDSINILNTLSIDSLSCYVTCEQRCRLELMEMGNMNPTESEIAACVAQDTACNRGALLDRASTQGCNSIYTQIVDQVSPGGCYYEQGEWWDSRIDTMSFVFLNDSTGNGADQSTKDSLTTPSSWNESWTAQLARLHPEYCRYLECVHSDSSRHFDYTFSELVDWYGTVWPSTPGDLDLLSINISSEDPMFSQIFGLYPNYKNITALSEYESAIYTALDNLDPTQSLSSTANAQAISQYLLIYFQNQLASYASVIDGGPLVSLGRFIDENTETSNKSDAYKWALFKGMYLGTKYRMRRDILNAWCAIRSDACAIADASDLFAIDVPISPNTQSQGEEFIRDNDPNMCGALCEYRVEEWLAEIAYNCPDLTGTALSDIELNLFNYCMETCGTGNPLAYLLTDDVAASNFYLSNIISTINGSCSNSGSLILNDIGIAYDSVYTTYLDIDGNPVCDTTYRVSPCLITALSTLNIQLIQSATCDTIATQVYTGSQSSCFHTLSVDPDGLIRTSGGNNGCCTSFYLARILALDTLVFHPCNLDSISNPWVTIDGSGNATVRVQIYSSVGGVYYSFTASLICASSVPNSGGGGGSGSGQQAASSGNISACPIIIDTSCLVVPVDSFVNIDTLLHWCVDRLIQENIQIAEVIRQDSIDRIIEEVINKRRCLDGHIESFRVSYPTREHHYTLYYYDQAGNLIQTIPPEGVDVLPSSAFSIGGQWLGSEPTHSQPTKYQYNTLGQVIWQESPDGGATDFKYDYAQRLRASRNAKQLIDNTYSYTRYDGEGRIIEVGELESPATSFTSLTEGQLNDYTFPSTSDGTLTEVTTTEYNTPSVVDNDFAQSYLRGRVAVTQNDAITTRYSYDEHGNVSSLQHELSDLNGEKQRVDYDYDLISGNVRQVSYQSGRYDAFYHRYEYDADNRLTHVQTSLDSVIWEEDARYFYYAHGPLARVELANDKVQGQDYYYTLQGWIKGVNSSGSDSQTYEPGRDGEESVVGENQWLGRDAMAYALAYHEQDYQPIGAVNLGAAQSALWSGIGAYVLGKTFNSGVTVKGLFNGNITAMLTDIRRPDATGWNSLQSMSYQYDQLHRIRKADSHHYDPVSGAWTYTNDYKSRYVYDANGNLDTLERYGPQGPMDQLIYNYNGTAGPNQLDHVRDLSLTPSAYPDDIEDQLSGNYTYDAIGNLIADNSQQVNLITWTVYGKVESVFFSNGNKTEFTYDASGNRLTKKRIPGPSSVGYPKTTYYLRDASGNVLSIYEKTEFPENITGGNVIISQKEISLYGSARLGLQKFSERIQGGGVSGRYRRERGSRIYELSNHLGNVLSTISDQKEGVAGNDPWQAAHYESVVSSVQDYYPFGLTMPGRQYSSPLGSRYAFNGKEKDSNGEWGNTLNNYDYGFRIYNPSIAKFLSVDPIAASYPMLTPYQFASNTPIGAIDLDGLESKVVIVMAAEPNEFSANRRALEQRGYTALEVRTGEELLESLVQFIDSGEDPIENLVILSHGYTSGLVGAEYNTGLYSLKGFIKLAKSEAQTNVFYEGDERSIFDALAKAGFEPAAREMYDNGARSLYSLEQLVQNGKIRFTDKASVVLGGCNTGVCQEVIDYERDNTEVTTDSPLEVISFASDFSKALDVPVVGAGPEIRGSEGNQYKVEGATQPYPTNSNNTPLRQAAQWYIFYPDGTDEKATESNTLDLSKPPFNE